MDIEWAENLDQEMREHESQSQTMAGQYREINPARFRKSGIMKIRDHKIRIKKIRDDENLGP